METKVENGKHYKLVQGEWFEYQPRKTKPTRNTSIIKRDLPVSIQVGNATYRGTARLVRYQQKGLGYTVKLDADQEIYGGGSLFIR